MQQGRMAVLTEIALDHHAPIDTVELVDAMLAAGRSPVAARLAPIAQDVRYHRRRGGLLDGASGRRWGAAGAGDVMATSDGLGA